MMSRLFGNSRPLGKNIPIKAVKSEFTGFQLCVLRRWQTVKRQKEFSFIQLLFNFLMVMVLKVMGQIFFSVSEFQLCLKAQSFMWDKSAIENFIQSFFV